MNFVPPELETILRQTSELQRAYLVGGCARDALAGLPHGKDFDVEVFGLGVATDWPEPFLGDWLWPG